MVNVPAKMVVRQARWPYVQIDVCDTPIRSVSEASMSIVAEPEALPEAIEATLAAYQRQGASFADVVASPLLSGRPVENQTRRCAASMVLSTPTSAHSGHHVTNHPRYLVPVFCRRAGHGALTTSAVHASMPESVGAGHDYREQP